MTDNNTEEVAMKRVLRYKRVFYKSLKEITVISVIFILVMFVVLYIQTANIFKYKSVESIIKFVIEAGGMPYITILPLSLFISLVTSYIIRIFFKRRKYFEEIFMMIFILNMGIGGLYIKSNEVGYEYVPKVKCDIKNRPNGYMVLCGDSYNYIFNDEFEIKEERKRVEKVGEI
jgi:hypothetical protein